MNPFAFLTRRVRGFRVIDIAAVTLIVTIAVGSYAFKTFASGEDADAHGVESQILQEQKQNPPAAGRDRPPRRSPPHRGAVHPISGHGSVDPSMRFQLTRCRGSLPTPTDQAAQAGGADMSVAEPPFDPSAEATPTPGALLQGVSGVSKAP